MYIYIYSANVSAYNWTGTNDICLKELLTNTALHTKLNLGKQANSN